MRQPVAGDDQAHLAARDHPDADAQRLRFPEAEQARADPAPDRLGDDGDRDEREREADVAAELAPVGLQADADEEHRDEHRVGQRVDARVDPALERRPGEEHAGEIGAGDRRDAAARTPPAQA